MQIHQLVKKRWVMHVCWHSLSAWFNTDNTSSFCPKTNSLQKLNWKQSEFVHRYLTRDVPYNNAFQVCWSPRWFCIYGTFFIYESRPAFESNKRKPLSRSFCHRFRLIRGAERCSSERNEINQLQRLFYLQALSCRIVTGSFQTALAQQHFHWIAVLLLLNYNSSHCLDL